MKVLHVVPTYWPAVRYGGPIYSVHGLCAALARQGASVTVFTTSVDGRRNSDVEHEKVYDKDGVQICYFESKLIRRIYYSMRLKQSLDKRIKEFDLVHLHSVFLYPTNIAARIAVKNRIPYVISPRGMLEKGLIKNKSSVVKTLWLKIFEKRTLEQSDLIHLTSSREQRELSLFDYSLPNITIIPNGVDDVLNSNHAGYCKTDIFQVLYIGRLNWKKQIDKLITAVSLIDFPIRLVIAGNDENGYKDNLEKLIDQLKIKQNNQIKIDFVGTKIGQDKNDLFIKSNVMVLPSLSENFGNTVVESLALGCPVIVTPEVGASEVVRKANAGLITDGSVKDIADKIAQLKNNPEQAMTMGNNGINEIKQNYQWSKIADSMMAAYREIV